MDRLTPEDQLMLWPDELWPQEIGVVGVLDGQNLLDESGNFRIDTARAVVGSRLHLLPRFRQLLHVPPRVLGGPLWVDAPVFDLTDHVRVAPLPAPGEEAQLLLAAAELLCHRLDRSRPLWEIWFLPGLADHRVGVVIKIHHVVADGITGVARLATLLDVTPVAEVPTAGPWAPRPWPSTGELFVDALQRRLAGTRRRVTAIRHPLVGLRRARAAWPALQELLAQEPGPRTSLNRLVGPGRRLALVRCDLAAVQEAAHANAATVNDVLLALTAGGLRGLLGARGELVGELTLPVYVPVSLHLQAPGQRGGNLISQMVVPLPVGMDDPGRRLRMIAAATTERKAMGRPSLGVMFSSRLLGAAMLRIVAAKRVNVETADVPGPDERLHFAGAPLLEMFPLLNLLGNVSLGVGALSYAGQFNVMAIGDADAFPDLDVFAAHAQDELRRLSERRPAAG